MNDREMRQQADLESAKHPQTGTRCRWCRKPIDRVFDDWRDGDWLTWCSQDQRHAPDFSQTQQVKMVRS